MMTNSGRSTKARSFVLVVSTVLAIAFSIEPAVAQTSSLKEKSFRQDGVRRNYLLYTPQNARKRTGQQPLVIVMHGGGGTHRAMVKFTKHRWNELADQYGFYVVYPNAREREWDIGEGATSEDRKRRVDDLAYFNRIVDDVSARLPIDENRVFATGHSRGGAASYFLGCKMSDRVRAIAPVSMPLPGYLEDDCVDGRPVGIAILHGTHDPQVPYDGGYINVLGVKRDPVLSTEKTLSIWRDRNGCSTTPTSTTRIDKPDDRTSVDKSEWSDCSGAPVTLFRIENGGHTWPSGSQYLPVRLVGEVSNDIDAANEIWQFFSKFQSDNSNEVVVDEPVSNQGGYFREQQQLEGYPSRPYDVFVPAGLKAPAPVLLVLHGGGADAANAIKTTCPGGDVTHTDCITHHAARNGYIAVFPRGTARKLIPKMRSWNAGGGDEAKQWICVSGPACDGKVDDIAYFRALLDELEQSVAILDKRRVYVTGISNGAAMTHRLGCEMSDKIAAIAAIEGANQFSTLTDCVPGRPVPVLQIHGTADCAWPYDGGAPSCQGAPRLNGEFVSVDRSNEVWRQINGCAKDPQSRRHKPQFDDGTQVEIFTWQQCKAPLVSYRIDGGGHTWPNGYQYLPKQRIGAVTREVTNDDIWTFLAAHTLP